MKLIIGSLAAGLVVLTASAVFAQDSSDRFTMGTYYRCNQGDAAKADAIYEEHIAPFMKAEQSAGRIQAFGYLKHRSGGEWRRLEYAIGSNLDQMMDSRDALIKMTESAEHQKALDEFDRICPSHDDYIWRVKASSQSAAEVGQDRAPFGSSTYWICNAQESEADAIVESVFAPVLNQRVKDGAIASWVWMEHIMGGQYRRLLVMDGASEKALISNWAGLQDALQKASPDMSRRFSEICHIHTDYIWEN
jgi:hypothetical protein